jgi:hypothetical protein
VEVIDAAESSFFDSSFLSDEEATGAMFNQAKLSS